MIWSPEFKQRVLFNASKAYVRQKDAGEEYELLQPVYSLNLVNDIFEPDLEEYYHYYRMVHVEHTERVIKQSSTQKWLRSLYKVSLLPCYFVQSEGSPFTLRLNGCLLADKDCIAPEPW